MTTDQHFLTLWEPDLTGIPMDEALYGEPVYLLKELPDAWLIKTLTGYWGYAAKAGIRRVDKPEFIRLLNAPKATLLRNHRVAEQDLPSGCRLMIGKWSEGPNCELETPGGSTVEVPKSICRRSERDTAMEELIAYVRTFQSWPYNLGGKNRSTGIDCSGLVQLGYRALGVNLPRDAKQQYLGGHLILPCVKEALLPGDALFFMNEAGQVDHVALYLGKDEILHATGKRVRLDSVDPSATNYLRRLEHDFIGAKRFWW